MFFPFALAAPTSEDFARRLDMPIPAVPSMIAAMPVVEPSAAMSNVVPGCSALKCSASCGTSFAPSVSEPLMTRRSALASAKPNATARTISSEVSFIIIGSFRCSELSICTSEFDVQVGHEKLVSIEWIDTNRDGRAAGAEIVIDPPPVVVGNVEDDRVGQCVTRANDHAFHVLAAIEDIVV